MQLEFDKGRGYIEQRQLFLSHDKQERYLLEKKMINILVIYYL